MAKLLLHYGKDGPLKYLSHLELIRAFERSFRRAGVEVEASGGFNPRPKISYGPALPVGTSSSCEYLVAEVKSSLCDDDIIERISRVLPKGLSVFRAKYITEKQPSIASIIECVAYKVEVKTLAGAGELSSLVELLRNEERLLIKHKGKEKWVDTKESILDWNIEEAGGGRLVFLLLLAAGERNSVRPEVLIDKVNQSYPQVQDIEVVGIERVAEYVNRDIPLIDIYDFYKNVTIGSECEKS